MPKGPQAYGSTPRFQANKDSFITVRWVNGTTEEAPVAQACLRTTPAVPSRTAWRSGRRGGIVQQLERYRPLLRMDLLFTRTGALSCPGSDHSNDYVGPGEHG